MDDIRITTALPHHPKVKRLEQKLGAAGFSGLIKLFCWVGDNRPDGNLRGLTDEDLELAVNWTGSKSLVKVLVEVGFVDGKAKHRSIHNWAVHQPYVATRPQRIEKARAAAMARWERVAPEERSKQAKKAADARWQEASDASGMHAPSTHESNKSKENAIPEQQSDACAEHAECVPPSLPFPTPHTHAPSCSISSQQEVEYESSSSKEKSSPDLDDLKKSFLSKCEDPNGMVAAMVEIVCARAERSGTAIKTEAYLMKALDNFNTQEGQDREELMQFMHAARTVAS